EPPGKQRAHYRPGPPRQAGGGRNAAARPATASSPAGGGNRYTSTLPDGLNETRIQAMTVVSVEHALAGKVAAGGEVTVRGWVRTRRDSKAGLSFVNVSDGSCFAPIQVVAPALLDN